MNQTVLEQVINAYHEFINSHAYKFEQSRLEREKSIWTQINPPPDPPLTQYLDSLEMTNQEALTTIIRNRFSTTVKTDEIIEFAATHFFQQNSRELKKLAKFSTSIQKTINGSRSQFSNLISNWLFREAWEHSDALCLSLGMCPNALTKKKYPTCIAFKLDDFFDCSIDYNMAALLHPTFQEYSTRLEVVRDFFNSQNNTLYQASPTEFIQLFVKNKFKIPDALQQVPTTNHHHTQELEAAKAKITELETTLAKRPHPEDQRAVTKKTNADNTLFAALFIRYLDKHPQFLNSNSQPNWESISQDLQKVASNKEGKPPFGLSDDTIKQKLGPSRVKLQKHISN